jgi:hypothetical protein
MLSQNYNSNIDIDEESLYYYVVNNKLDNNVESFDGNIKPSDEENVQTGYAPAVEIDDTTDELDEIGKISKPHNMSNAINELDKLSKLGKLNKLSKPISINSPVKTNVDIKNVTFDLSPKETIIKQQPVVKQQHVVKQQPVIKQRPVIKPTPVIKRSPMHSRKKVRNSKRKTRSNMLYFIVLLMFGLLAIYILKGSTFGCIHSRKTPTMDVKLPKVENIQNMPTPTNIPVGSHGSAIPQLSIDSDFKAIFVKKSAN